MMRALESTTPHATSGNVEGGRDPNLAFVGWASGIFLVGSLAMLLLSRHVTGGRIVYTVDDAAIHLSTAETLLHHGTWGLQAGVYQSASSSPLWDVILAGAMWLTGTRDILPWLLNVAGGLWLIWAVGSRQKVLRPSRRAPHAVLATAALVVVVLFMPSLTMVGMEDLLHSAMVVQLVAWMHDRAVLRTTPTPEWAPYLLAALAVLIRFETMWVAAGLGLGYLVDGWVRNPHDRLAAQRLRRVLWLAFATVVPVAAYAAFNRAMGQGFLPNSVLAKSAPLPSPLGFLNRLNSDHVVTVLLIGAAVYLAVAGHSTARSIVPAVTLAVSVVAHTIFARYGYFERYQEYLIALGVYFALSVAGESLEHRSKAVSVIVLAVLVLTPLRWNLLILTPEGADNTYQQRYQAALFLRQYFEGRPVATSELGYISLMHRGGLTDLLGLGDYGVLEARMNGTDDRAFYADMARRRGFQVAIMYPFSLGRARTPTGWFLVASWNLRERRVSAYPSLQFWASGAAAAPLLRADLLQFAHHLPHHVTQVLNGCLDAELTHTPTLLCTTSGP